MLWFFIAFLGYFFLALVFLLDKFILTESAGRPVVYTFYSTVFLFAGVLVFPFVGFQLLAPIDMLWAAVSGVTFGFALWALFSATKSGEASHINPFNGASVTVFSFVLAFFFLAEQLRGAQYVGVVVLIVASCLLSFEKSKKHNGFHIGFLWAALSGALFAASHVSAKYLYGVYEFWPAFLWTRIFIGLVAVVCLFFPVVWKSFRKPKKRSKKVRNKYVVFLFVLNKVIAILAVVCLQYASAIGSVTLVSALAGVQYVFLFSMVLLLTFFAPKVFKEYFTRREFVMEIVAIVLVVIGSALFVF